MYEIVIRKKAQKNLKKLPLEVVQLFHILLSDLSGSGPNNRHGRIIPSSAKVNIIAT